MGRAVFTLPMISCNSHIAYCELIGYPRTTPPSDILTHNAGFEVDLPFRTLYSRRSSA